ncbi:MAG: hypothetical protein HY017_17320 [Betaproteobacteria bacterium]|nr:hypothetical protein [Betaproteobacteria bacterium]
MTHRPRASKSAFSRGNPARYGARATRALVLGLRKQGWNDGLNPVIERHTAAGRIERALQRSSQ